jgi:hypothetical protein
VDQFSDLQARLSRQTHEISGHPPDEHPGIIPRMTSADRESLNVNITLEGDAAKIVERCLESGVFASIDEIVSVALVVMAQRAIDITTDVVSALDDSKAGETTKN